ncbi:MBL fold metallo-hydrolase, partial [Frankia sp. CcWB2]
MSDADGGDTSRTGYTEYTGKVTVGGPADVRTLPGLSITKIAVGPMNNNAYLLRCPVTGEQLLVDAANEADTLLRLVGDAGLATVVTSHQHDDHVQALAAVVTTTGASTVAHPDDAPAIPVPTARQVRDGDEVAVGTATLRVIHLVGHTPVHRPALRGRSRRPHLFTGDCLFPGGPGNTFGDEQAFTTLMDGLERKIFGPLPD